MIGRKAGETAGLQQPFVWSKDRIFAATNNRRQDCTRVVIDGMPQPSLVLLLADKTPPRIPLRFPSALHVHADVVGMQGASQGLVDGLQRRFWLFERTEDGVRTARQHPRRIADPTGVEAHVNDAWLGLGHTLDNGRQAETACGTPVF